MGRSVGGDANGMPQLYAIRRARLDLELVNRVKAQRHGSNSANRRQTDTQRGIRPKECRRQPGCSSANISIAGEQLRTLGYLRACLSASKQ